MINFNLFPRIFRNNGIKSACYHADLPYDIKNKVHEKWYSNHYQVIVATVAFGMGIDKPDVRFVIHQTMPKSVENYYQESGRAGRDDADAACILYYRFGDIFRQSSMICTEKTGLENLFAMVKYCHLSNVCRRKTLADHFGENWSNDWCPKKCDNCVKINQEPPSDVTSEAKIVTDLLSKSQQKLTGLKVLDSLSKSLSKSLTRDHCERLIVELLLKEYLKLDFHFTPYSIITYLALGPKARLLSDSDVSTRIFMNFNSSQKQVENGSNRKRKLTKNPTVSNDADNIIDID